MYMYTSTDTKSNMFLNKTANEVKLILSTAKYEYLQGPC